MFDEELCVHGQLRFRSHLLSILPTTALKHARHMNATTYEYLCFGVTIVRCIIIANFSSSMVQD